MKAWLENMKSIVFSQLLLYVLLGILCSPFLLVENTGDLALMVYILSFWIFVPSLLLLLVGYSALHILGKGEQNYLVHGLLFATPAAGLNLLLANSEGSHFYQALPGYVGLGFFFGVLAYFIPKVLIKYIQAIFN